jgi:hypothetical protein
MPESSMKRVNDEVQIDRTTLKPPHRKTIAANNSPASRRADRGHLTLKNRTICHFSGSRCRYPAITIVMSAADTEAA